MFELKNYLKNLPQDYKANQAFKDWLHDEADIDTKRSIVKSVEKRIKRMAGYRDLHLPHIDEKNWKLLEALIKVRQATLDEMMIPTKEEVEMMSRLNDNLLDLTHQLYTKMAEMWKVMNNSGLATDDDYCVEGAFDYEWEEEDAVLKLNNDDWYGSNFYYMLWVLGEFDKKDRHTMMHIHETLETFGEPEEKVMKECYDFLDDGDTWTDGALWKPAFNDIIVCYMLHAVCCHFHYSLADVLRMDNFAIRVNIEYGHTYSEQFDKRIESQRKR